MKLITVYCGMGLEINFTRLFRIMQFIFWVFNYFMQRANGIFSSENLKKLWELVEVDS